MSHIKRILIDVLKPHAPDALAFSQAIAEQGDDYRVKLTIAGVDANTESVMIVVEGEDIRFDAIANTIRQLGASLHSIDEVEVVSTADPAPTG